jgi:hypothetical protein
MPQGRRHSIKGYGLVAVLLEVFQLWDRCGFGRDCSLGTGWVQLDDSKLDKNG